MKPLVALAMQGGGALGAYQFGVYEALHAAGLEPDWACGVSIGAVNAALIAGNPPERRLAALRGFWEGAASSLPAVPWMTPPEWLPAAMADMGALAHRYWSEAAAAKVILTGVPGLFAPRPVPPPFAPDGTDAALSLYDPAPLRASLERLVDWDLLNDGPVRVTIAAVEVETGDFRVWDTRGDAPVRLTPDHLLASGALPPGFPPVRIDGVAYWDGALTSNTPLQMVLDAERERDLNIFQLDLFSARAPMPRTLIEAVGRRTDITFSSRTRLLTDVARALSPTRAAVRRLLASGDPGPEDRALLEAFAAEPAVVIGQLIYRDKPYDGAVKDFEFSAPTLARHAAAGRRDAEETLRLRDWTAAGEPGVLSLDWRDAPDGAPRRRLAPGTR